MVKMALEARNKYPTVGTYYALRATGTGCARKKKAVEQEKLDDGLSTPFSKIRVKR